MSDTTDTAGQTGVATSPPPGPKDKPSKHVGFRAKVPAYKAATASYKAVNGVEPANDSDLLNWCLLTASTPVNNDVNTVPRTEFERLEEAHRDVNILCGEQTAEIKALNEKYEQLAAIYKTVLAELNTVKSKKTVGREQPVNAQPTPAKAVNTATTKAPAAAAVNKPVNKPVNTPATEKPARRGFFDKAFADFLQ